MIMNYCYNILDKDDHVFDDIISYLNSRMIKCWLLIIPYRNSTMSLIIGT